MLDEKGTMDTSGRSLGREGRLLITVGVASVEGLAVHPAHIGTEVSCGKLPAECPEAGFERHTGLFEPSLEFFDDFVEFVSHLRLPSTRKQAHAQTHGSLQWKSGLDGKAASSR